MTDYPPDDYGDHRRRPDEYDDAWAGGDEDAVFDDPAGSLWEDPQRAARREAAARRADAGAGPVPNPLRGDPTYHREQARRSEYAEYYEPPRLPAHQPAPAQRPAARMPFWGILILVILGLFALMAILLACVAVLSL